MGATKTLFPSIHSCTLRSEHRQTSLTCLHQGDPQRAAVARVLAALRPHLRLPRARGLDGGEGPQRVGG